VQKALSFRVRALVSVRISTRPPILTDSPQVQTAKKQTQTHSPSFSMPLWDIDNSESSRYGWHGKPGNVDNMPPQDTDIPSAALAPKRCAVCSSKAHL
jgi:hypothetical protein